MKAHALKYNKCSQRKRATKKYKPALLLTEIVIEIAFPLCSGTCAWKAEMENSHKNYIS